MTTVSVLDRAHKLAAPEDTRVPGQLQRAVLEYCGLTPSTTLIEIGCGLGRLAYELAGYLSGGRYSGFDIARRAVSRLNEDYSPFPEFEFHSVMARNDRYTPKARNPATSVRFPAGTGVFDMVCAFSVFTHMRLDDVRHYLAETSRILRPGGVAVLTFFSVRDDEISPRLGRHGHFIPIGNAPGPWTLPFPSAPWPSTSPRS